MGKISAIDLFCGAGGSSFGAIKAGVEIKAAFDYWDVAIKTFKHNFPTVNIFQENLQTISDEKIRAIKSEIGNIDLILASPECTNHSKAKGGGERDEKSRETAFEVVRFANEFKPPWVIIENVVEMQSWVRFPELLNRLSDLGYSIKLVILNSKDFNIPQSRERLFLLCSLNGPISEPLKDQINRRPISTVIDKSQKYSASLLRKKGRAQNTLHSAERAISSLGQNDPFLLVYYGSGRKGNGGWQRISDPLGTITTLDRFAYVFPDNGNHMMRMLQPEELKIAMGFDNSYQIQEVQGITRRDRVKLMGNGVCPPVMKAIIDSMIFHG